MHLHTELVQTCVDEEGWRCNHEVYGTAWGSVSDSEGTVPETKDQQGPQVYHVENS